MKRKIGMLIIITVILTSLTGCWSRKELNDLAIAVAMGIDKDEEHFIVTLQIVNASEIASKKASGRTPVVMYQATGDTLHQAFRRMTTVLPRKAYMSHLQMLVIGEELAKEGFGKALDVLSRYHEMRTDFFVVVSKGIKAENILSFFTAMQKIPANQMFDSLKMSEKNWAATGKIQLEKLITDITLEGKDPVLTGIEIKGNAEKGGNKENTEKIDPYAVLQYSGMAVFKSDKLVGWLNEDESKGFNYTQGKVKSTVINVSCPKGGGLAVELFWTKEKIKGKVEDGKPKIDFELRAEGNVSDVECDIDLSKTKSIYELEKRVEQDIKGNIEAALKKSQKKYKVDIFGFGEAIHRSEPKAWKEMKKNWSEEYFPDLPVNIKIDVKIRRTGTITKSFQEKIKE